MEEGDKDTFSFQEITTQRAGRSQSSYHVLLIHFNYVIIEELFVRLASSLGQLNQESSGQPQLFCISLMVGVLHVGGGFSEQHWILYVLPCQVATAMEKTARSLGAPPKGDIDGQGSANQELQSIGRFSQIPACVRGRGARQSTVCVNI